MVSKGLDSAPKHNILCISVDFPSVFKPAEVRDGRPNQCTHARSGGHGLCDVSAASEAREMVSNGLDSAPKHNILCILVNFPSVYKPAEVRDGRPNQCTHARSGGHGPCEVSAASEAREMVSNGLDSAPKHNILCISVNFPSVFKPAEVRNGRPN